ncbi:MAG: hypothetical protein ACREHV_13135 [Rhizomicrobium sp.]
MTVNNVLPSAAPTGAAATLFFSTTTAATAAFGRDFGSATDFSGVWAATLGTAADFAETAETSLRTAATLTCAALAGFAFSDACFGGAFAGFLEGFLFVAIRRSSLRRPKGRHRSSVQLLRAKCPRPNA